MSESGDSIVRLSRRAFLATGLVGATRTALAHGPFVVRRRKPRLRVLGTHVTLQESIRRQAEADLGIELVFQPRGSAAVLQQASVRPHTFDVFEQWSNSIRVLWQAEAIQPIRTERIEAWSEINNLTKTGKLTKDARFGRGDAPHRLLHVQPGGNLGPKPSPEISFLPYAHNVDSFGYATSRVPVGVPYETESWGWLLDDRWHGKVALVNEPTIGIFDAALAVEAAGLMKFRDIGAITRDEIDQLFAILIEKKRAGHFYGAWNSVPQSVDFMRKGRVVIESMFSPAVAALNSKAIPVNYAAPKEGYRAWHGVMCLSSKTEGAALDAAYEFMNWWLSGWAGAQIARQGYYISVPERARQFLQPYEWDYWYGGKPAVRDLPGPDGRPSVRAGSSRRGGSYQQRFANIAVWNTVMDTYEYSMHRWYEFLDRMTDSIRKLLTRSLSTKIAAAFGVVLVMHAAIALLAHIGMEKAQSETTRFDSGRRVAQRIIEIDRRVGVLQRHVLTFTYTGHQSLPELIAETKAGLVADLEWARRQTQDDRGREEIESMLSALDRYHEQFQLASVDRQRCLELIETDMPEIIGRGHRSFTAMLDRMHEHGDKVGARLVASAQRRFFAAEDGARSYVLKLDSAGIRAATRHVKQCRVDLDRLVTHQRSGIQVGLQDAYAVLPRFQRLLVQIVQATRGYLHLTKVVMAGEAAEFLRASARLRETHLQRLDKLGATILADHASFQWISAIISLVTILVGIIASGLVGRVVVNPLRRITQTLSGLARGDETESIPDRDREDEIGAMAKAAEVFRHKNLETARMLHEIQALAEQHEATITDLEASNRELDNFAHIASHDLKTPLRAMGLLVAWIEEDSGDELKPEVREHVATLRTRIRRMGRLLDDLLTFAKAGQAGVELESVCVTECAREAVDMVAVPDGFRVDVRGAETTLYTARIALMQVLQNLVSNAVKHHHLPNGQIEITVREDASEVEITVADDGPGIAQEHHQLMFQAFRTPHSGSELDHGGVGLALVRKNLERFDGSVRVESAVGSGTKMHVRWPKHAPPSVEGRATDEDARQPEAVGSHD